MPAAENSANSEPNAQPLVGVLLAFSVGIVADRYVPLPVPTWLLVGFLGSLVFLLLRRKSQATATLALVVGFAAVGAARHHLRWNLCDDADLSLRAKERQEPVCLRVYALTTPRRMPAPPHDPMRSIPAGSRTVAEVRIERMRDGRRWNRAAGKATMLVDGHLLGVHAGDRLDVFGFVALPSAARNPGEFDFRLHNRADGKLSVLNVPGPDCVTVVERSSRIAPVRLLADLQGLGQRQLDSRLSEDQRALAAALLLGQRDQTGPARAEPFFTTGLLHLLVVSGLHVGILATTLYLLFQFSALPRRGALISVALLVVLYSQVTGGQPPALRAAVLFVIYCTAKFLGRRAIGFNALAAAALIVLALNPADLFRTAPQLSFLAVAVLTWFGNSWPARQTLDPLARLIANTRPWPHRAARRLGVVVWQMTLAGALVWVITLPLALNRFHLLSPAAIGLNPLLWPILVVALVSGFVVLSCGWLLPPLADLAAGVCEFSLGGLNQMVRMTQQLPGSHTWTPGPEPWWLIGFYGGLGLLALVPNLRPPRRWAIAILAAWCAVGFGVGALRGSGDELTLTFISLDHGCCAIAELPGGETILYDAGRLGSPEPAIRATSAYLWSRGKSRIDAVILSHSDADHYNALPGLLKRFHVAHVYVSPTMFENPNASLEALRTAIVEQGIPISEIWQNDRLRTAGRAELEILHPPRQGVLGSDNANSIVLKIDYQGRRCLLPGDLESPGLDDVIAEAALDCDLLMAPHHGSRNSDPPGFSAWCSPEWVVISSGYRHDVEQVEAAFADAGAQVRSTWRDGAVQATIRDGEIQVRTFR